MCADRSVRYGWERSSIDRCALLLRSLLAIGNDIVDLLRVIGGLDLACMLLWRWTESDRDASEVLWVSECTCVAVVGGVDVGGAGGI